MNNDKKYINAFNLILQDIENTINPAIVDNFIKAFTADGSFTSVFNFQDNKIASIKLAADESLKIFAWQLLSDLSDEDEQKVITIFNTIFSLSDIKSDNFFLKNLSKMSQEDIDRIKEDLPNESDLDDAFDKLLD